MLALHLLQSALVSHQCPAATSSCGDPRFPDLVDDTERRAMSHCSGLTSTPMAGGSGSNGGISTDYRGLPGH
jgi:hypothetical protein